ncbi:hypothetical protein [Hydrogenispora ethanolica]|jgi:hypothetical protein|uniref:hypothetical protein n=1 Tax=Hydrogenispora ethanolica TaxID=1082276 RepID=UPI0010461CF2|nr:hypothetical protein [Hydrogenispora ethanolica]
MMRHGVKNIALDRGAARTLFRSGDVICRNSMVNYAAVAPDSAVGFFVASKVMAPFLYLIELLIFQKF